MPQPDAPQVQRAGGGRLLAMPLHWRGHHLQLVTAYLPNNAAQQRAFIAAHLREPAQHGTGPAAAVQLWGGDWNFVEDINLDRSGASAATASSSVASTAALQQVAAGMIDVYRQLHPSHRGYTHHNRGGAFAARLDRWYAPSALVPYVARVTLGPTPSDHRPVVLHLAPRAVPNVGRGLPRLRLQPLWQDPQSREAFEAWVALRLSKAPQEDAALLLWWAAFKAALLEEGLRLTRALAARQQQSLQRSRETARDELAATYQAAAAQPQQPGSVQRVLAAQQTFSEAVASDWQLAELQQRHQWLAAGERPSPAQTSALRSSASTSSRAIPALRNPATGALLPPGPAQADLAAAHWAGVSAAADTSAAAQQQVLQALRQHSARLSAEQASLLEHPEVDEGEVGRALKGSPPGKAPGEDGLPVDIYKRLHALFAPILARIFSAAGRGGVLPQGFLDGVISMLYKAGDRCSAANYRPITLLNTDYRVLAKALAARLQRVLGRVVAGSQSAFLKGRHIAQNVFALQALPAVLPSDSSALVAYVDFAKAYDTVDRQFLFAAMEALGVGPVYLGWVRRLLANTRARALVNGFLSRPASFEAGVRQGCPLAPLLYLFVGQALHCHLVERGLGVVLAGGRLLTCLQFADDVQVLLRDMAAAHTLVPALGTFREATGQGQNVGKSGVLPVGRDVRLQLSAQGILAAKRSELLAQRQHSLLSPPQQLAWARRSARARAGSQAAAVPQGLTLAGMPVVARAKALGVVIDADGAPHVDWEDLVGKVLNTYGGVAGMGLSAFGRAFASAAYGISTTLYAAEMAGAPPPQLVDKLERATARLVEAGKAPNSGGRGGHSLPARLLAGAPGEGGWGALPWLQHIEARGAVQLSRLMRGAHAEPPDVWTLLAHQLWQGEGGGGLWPWMGLFFAAGKRPDGSELPQPLKRLTTSFARLPPLQDVSRQPPLAGVWCFVAPLWGNPFITRRGGGGLLGGCLESQGFSDLAGVGCLRLLGDLLLALRVVQGAAISTGGIPGLQRYAAALLAHPCLRDASLARNRLHALRAAVDPSWLAGAMAGQRQAPWLDTTQDYGVGHLLQRRLGWQQQGVTCTALELDVHSGTRLQLESVRRERGSRLRAFYVEAGAPAGGVSADEQEDAVLAWLGTVWALPWDNNRKEAAFRLALDAVHVVRFKQLTGAPCACGAVGQGRAHAFWDCPVAAAVVSAIRRQLPSGTVLRREHLWLGRPPMHPMDRGVWEVVAVAAVAAMTAGLKLLSAWERAPRRGAGHHPPPPRAEQRVGVAARQAVLAFWVFLQDFTVVQRGRQQWVAGVPLAHPFLQRRGGNQVALEVNRQ